MAQRDGQAGDTAEIEITPAMIQAGVRALQRYVGEDGQRLFADEEIVRLILTETLERRG